MKKQFLQIGLLILFIVVPSQAQWVQSAEGLPKKILAGFDFGYNPVFSLVDGTDTIYAASKQVFYSADNGATWAQMTDLPNGDETEYLFFHGTLYAKGKWHEVMYKWENNNWITITVDKSVSNNNTFQSLTGDGSNLYALTGVGVLLKSKDKGDIWEQINLTIGYGDGTGTLPYGVGSITYKFNKLFLAPKYVSDDGGMTWNELTGIGTGGHYICNSGDAMYLVGDDSLFMTTDGETWTIMGSKPNSRFLTTADNTLYLAMGGGADKSVFRSTDNGKSWFEFDDGMVPDANTLYPRIGGIIHTGNYLVAADAMGTQAMFRYDLSIATAVQNGRNVPADFRLKQNFPNPFNPSTNIEYEIPGTSNVIIKVYNLLGEEVKTLVNETKTAGNYLVKFNATGLSSGIYFYRIVTDNFTATRKMILLK